MEVVRTFFPVLPPTERRVFVHLFRTQLKRALWFLMVLTSAAALVCTLAVTKRYPELGGRGLFFVTVSCVCVSWAQAILLHRDRHRRKRASRIVFDVEKGTCNSIASIRESAQALSETAGGGSGRSASDYARAFQRQFSEMLNSSSGRPLEFLYECAVRAAAEGLPRVPDVADVWIWCPPTDAREWIPYGLFSPKADDDEKKRERYTRSLLPRREKSWSKEVIDTDRPVLLSVGTDKEPATATAKLGLRTCLGIPIRLKRKAIGVMWLRYENAVDFKPVEIDALVEYWSRVTPDIEETRRGWDALTDEVTRTAVQAAEAAAF